MGRRRATTPASRPSSRGCCATTPAARRRCTRRGGCREAAGRPIYLKREDLHPHRRAQDQQRARPGAAGQADGQDADHRRDRRRPARRRDRHRLRAARPRVHRLHGHRGHAPPAAQRRSAWGCSARRSCRVEAGARTLKEAVSEAIRDWVTNVGDDPLHHRLERRPGAVPGARARPAARDRRRGARAAARAGRAAAGARRSPASAAARTRSASSCRSSTTPRSRSIGVEAAGEGLDTGRHGAPLTVGGRGGVLHGALLGDHAGRGRPDHRGALDLGRPRLPRLGPEHAHLRDSGRATLRGGHRRARRSTPSRRVARLEGIIPALESSHALPTRSPHGRRRDARPRSACRAAATRTSPRRWPRCERVSTGDERIAAAFAAAATAAPR